MRRADIPAATALTDLENWGCTPAIFSRLMRLDPGGCLKAVAGGETVGITTATSYGEVGWIGNVIVSPERRGDGIGRELVEHAIDYLENAGAETIRLNSYLHVTTLYESLGFKGEFENVRLHGVMGSGGRVPPPSLPLDDVVSFDTRYFGADRGRLLATLMEEHPRTFLSMRSEGVAGYLVGQVEEGSCEIAPWVVDPRHPEIARRLWRSLVTLIGRVKVALTAPTICKQAAEIARWAGLEEGSRTLRMYRGKRAHGGNPAGTIALGGLEKG